MFVNRATCIHLRPFERELQRVQFALHLTAPAGCTIGIQALPGQRGLIRGKHSVAGVFQFVL